MANAPSRFRFTQKAIEALPPNPPHARSTEAEYSDTQIPGFKCLVGKRGRFQEIPASLSLART